MLNMLRYDNFDWLGITNICFALTNVSFTLKFRNIIIFHFSLAPPPSFFFSPYAHGYIIKILKEFLKRILVCYLLAILLTGDILPGDILLAILFTGDIIYWRYFAWRYIAGDIIYWRYYWLAIFCLAIYCWRYFAGDISSVHRYIMLL